MKASLDGVERPLDSPLIANISVNEIDRRRQVVAAPLERSSSTRTA
jgi:hypothetical protein